MVWRLAYPSQEQDRYCWAEVIVVPIADIQNILLTRPLADLKSLVHSSHRYIQSVVSSVGTVGTFVGTRRTKCEIFVHLATTGNNSHPS